ncbi:Uncharacterised protein [Streptococcus pyogenes]|nr:Uncharacterised protein [Streptococcus pyogenes]VED99584.1 Uncharacterised protein [Streptococcus pyogenes]
MNNSQLFRQNLALLKELSFLLAKGELYLNSPYMKPAIFLKEIKKVV